MKHNPPRYYVEYRTGKFLKNTFFYLQMNTGGARSCENMERE